MRRRHHLFGFVTVLLVVVGGCGTDHGSHDGAAQPTRTVEIVMRDIAYEPATVSVAAGEIVTFVFRNEGQIRHDAFIGDEAAQAEHENEMRQGGAGDHHGADAITVDPGKSGSLTHEFKAGEALIIGCHEPGHYAAGMKVTLTVT